ncbi:MAG: peptidoglycan DD-metalloendopeptidase family protein [Candidatus Omnitrophota bacterium]
MNRLLLFFVLSIACTSCAPYRVPYPPSLSTLPVGTTRSYLVKEDDSLWRIAKDYGVSVDAIMKKNSMVSCTDLKVGQTIFIPDNHVLHTKLSFLWPIKGPVVNSFGEYSNNVINKGVNIKAKPGESILASEEGRVVYADYVKGWGRVIIVKHPDSFYTVYANLDDVYVNEGSMVKRAQAMGKASSSVNTESRILHFEIRKKYIADNPLVYLGKN